MDSDTWIRYKLNARDNPKKWYIRDDILDKDFQRIQASMYKNRRRFVPYTRRSFRKVMVGKVDLVSIMCLKKCNVSSYHNNQSSYK